MQQHSASLWWTRTPKSPGVRWDRLQVLFPKAYHLTGSWICSPTSEFAVIAIFTQSNGYLTHPGYTTFLLLGANTVFWWQYLLFFARLIKKQSFQLHWWHYEFGLKKVETWQQRLEEVRQGAQCNRSLGLLAVVQGSGSGRLRLWAGPLREVQCCGHSLAIRLQPEGLPNSHS